MSSAFDRMATKTGSIKRPPELDGDFKRGEAESVAGTFSCFPVDPLGAELATSVPFEKPEQARQTFVNNDVDIREGDILVVDGREYPVKYVDDYVWRSTVYRHVFLVDTLDD